MFAYVIYYVLTGPRCLPERHPLADVAHEPAGAAGGPPHPRRGLHPLRAPLRGQGVQPLAGDAAAPAQGGHRRQPRAQLRPHLQVQGGLGRLPALAQELARRGGAANLKQQARPMENLIYIYLKYFLSPLLPSVDKVHVIPTLGLDRDKLREAAQVEDIRKELTNCTYLEVSNFAFGFVLFFPRLSCPCRIPARRCWAYAFTELPGSPSTVVGHSIFRAGESVCQSGNRYK